MDKVLKAIDKAKLQSWAEYTANVSASTPVDLSETTKEKRDRIAKLEADPEAWFNYYFPKYAFAAPTGFHKAATRRIMDNPEWYEVRLWSRELAKSTRTMMEVFLVTQVGNPVYGPDKKTIIGRKKKKNVLLISNSQDNAERLLLPYKANLEANNRLINDYGIQQSIGNWEAGELVTKTGIAFRALGAGQSPRGSRNEEIRPDILLFDDIDTDEDCRNPEIIKKRWKWIEEAAMATRSISMDTLIIFCGNRIATDCCVQRATQFADHTDEVNIRDADGNSTWPSKNTEAHIDRVLSKISYAAIQKEYYNNPINEGSVFKEMAYKPARPMKEYSLLVCYTDPSYKESKKNDFKATLLVGKWKDEFHIIKAFVFQGTTEQMIDAHYEVMKVVGPCACYYYMEEVFLQDMFFSKFYAAGAATGKTIPIVGDKREKPDKFVRIESLLEPLNRNGKLYLNEADKEATGMKTLEQQFLAFAPGSRAHDDGPDAAEGAIWMLNNKEQIQGVGAITTVSRKRNRLKSY